MDVNETILLICLVGSNLIWLAGYLTLQGDRNFWFNQCSDLRKQNHKIIERSMKLWEDSE